MHWTSEYYRLLDARDPAAHAFRAPNLTVQVGNHPPVRGLEALATTELARHASVCRGSRHDFLNIWDVGENTAMLDAMVTFHRSDGQDVAIPCLTIMHRDHDGLIDNVRLFIDNRPLFEGIQA